MSQLDLSAVDIQDFITLLPEEIVLNIFSYLGELITISNLRSTNRFINRISTSIETLSSSRHIKIPVKFVILFPRLKEINGLILVEIQNLNEIFLLKEKVPNLQVANFLLESSYPSDFTQIINQTLTAYRESLNFAFITRYPDVFIFQPINKAISTTDVNMLVTILQQVPDKILIDRIYTYYINDDNYDDNIEKVASILHILYENEDEQYEIETFPDTPELISHRMHQFLQFINIEEFLGLIPNVITTRILDFSSLYRIILLYLQSKNVMIESYLDIPIEMANFFHISPRLQFDKLQDFVRNNIEKQLRCDLSCFNDTLYIYRPDNINGYIKDIRYIERVKP